MRERRRALLDQDTGTIPHFDVNRDDLEVVARLDANFVAGLPMVTRKIEGIDGGGMAVIGDGEPKGLPASLLGGVHVDSLGLGVGIDAFGVGRGRPHPIAENALRRACDDPIEARHPRHDDFIAVGLEHHVADATVDRDEGGIEHNDGHGGDGVGSVILRSSYRDGSRTVAGGRQPPKPRIGRK